ncbi:outer membrane beta-barrel domain-containing protein [Persicimonas caeni]|uniref:Outer membrane beta-barrel domain-containing protein n=1 Tax=Persicimonas caeni TaxID=2292766 RepID=A0A4Y6PX33_PERCE|nr:outer membrane beta-barrel domain-containing protein [Persicimonas caeni]QED34110.1 outer membrane beta-barrel domain-containing protein [Persicimonas caeni]
MKLQALRRKQEKVVKFHTQSSRLIGLLVFAALLVTLSPASAQEEGASEGDSSEAAATETSQEEALDPNDPDYWAKTRDIFTVQKRPFQKQGRFAATVYTGIIPNNIFEQYFPAGVRLNYYVLENIGLELSGSYAFKVDTGLQDTIEEKDGVGAQQVLIGDTQVFHSNFGVVWSPFYGKTAFYNTVLNYFDLYLMGGAGLVITETQTDFNAETSADYKPEGVLGAGLAFYFGENASVRADFRQFVFQKTNGGGVANPSEVSLGFGWFF